AVDYLEDAGFEVIEAHDGAQALQLLTQNPGVQVLFTDINMPGINGLDLARQVHTWFPRMHLIVTSGFERPSAAELPDDSRFLRKPYTSGEITGLVNAMVA
ncbi:MAG: response regulator receiver protein, partial [Caulobacteraceae bacterium]|nr:response regulator receiver protein [Caulobacteraceae bacterium]